MLYAAKCPNLKCDNPVRIPWKENCKLVRKPVIEEGEQCNQNGIARSDQSDIDIKASDKSVVPEKDLECAACHAKCTEKYVEKFIKAMEFTEMHLQNMKGTSVACILFALLL